MGIHCTLNFANSCSLGDGGYSQISFKDSVQQQLLITLKKNQAYPKTLKISPKIFIFSDKKQQQKYRSRKLCLFGLFDLII